MFLKKEATECSLSLSSLNLISFADLSVMLAIRKISPGRWVDWNLSDERTSEKMTISKAVRPTRWAAGSSATYFAVLSIFLSVEI